MDRVKIESIFNTEFISTLVPMDHAINFGLTTLVTAVIVGAGLMLLRLLAPTKAATKSRKAGKKGNQGGSKTKQLPDFIAEYGRCWCVQQLIPFVDSLLLGQYGQAMDNRMLRPWVGASHEPQFWFNNLDWTVRLPLIIMCMLQPRTGLLLAAHVVNIVSWATWMPAVWDHMVWAAILESSFVLAVLMGGSREDVARRFFPAIRTQLIALYFSAAFWKLTTSWYDTYTSCAPVLLSELLSGVTTPDIMPAGSAPANFLMQIAPVFVAALEFAVPTSMLISPRAGVALALVFHQTINLMPMTYAGGFSIAMCVRMCLLIPGGASAALTSNGGPIVGPSAFCTLVGGLMYAIHSGIDTAAIAFLVLCFLYLRSIMGGSIPNDYTKTSTISSKKWLCLVSAALAIVYGYVTPILGLQAMASSTMYGNLKQFGGTNHMVVPTGLLQTYYSDPEAQGPPWAHNAFGGGMVRVDFTNSSVLQQLAPAESTSQLPKHALELLQKMGASARYFELYAARNYFGRGNDLDASALHNRGHSGPRMDDPPYAELAYELRRVLSLARTRGEHFQLTYTRLPWKGSPAMYRDFVGPKITLDESGDGNQHCIVTALDGTVSPCAKDEIALQPTPPAWLRFLLHPYPMPLLEHDTTEVHCST